MLVARIAAAEQRAAELDAFTDRLRHALAAIDGPPRPGRCEPGCGFLHTNRPLAGPDHADPASSGQPADRLRTHRQRPNRTPPGQAAGPGPRAPPRTHQRGTAAAPAATLAGEVAALAAARGGGGGAASLLAASLLAATGLRVVPDQWVGLLGLVPIGFGVWGLWRLRGSDEDSRPPLASTAGRIATITFANGTDNISVFTPLFRSLRWSGSLEATALFCGVRPVRC